MKKRLLYLIIALILVGCSGTYGANDIMDCFGRDELTEECSE